MNEFARPNKSDIDFAVEGEYDNMPRVRRGGMQYNRLNPALTGRAPVGYKMVPDETPPVRTIDIRTYAEYQLFGDLDTVDWEQRFYDAAKSDKIVAHTILYVTTGAWGLRFITFILDIRVPVGTQDQIRFAANDVICDVLGEADFDLRYITKL
jgi:hypothetical protein